MAASKRARDPQPAKPGNRQSVPEPRRKAVHRARVAGGDALTGAVSQAEQDGAPDVSGVQWKSRSVPLSNNGKHPSTNGDIWRQAIALALANDLWSTVVWSWELGAWVVPSETDEDRAYIVRRDRTKWRQRLPFWEHFLCECPAAKKGLLVCKHKAAVCIQRNYRQLNGFDPFKK